MHWLKVLQHWLAIHTGTDNEPGSYYGFWSGFGSDIGELALIGAVVTGLRHINCFVPGCWRIGKYLTADGLHKVCRHHHPDLGPKRPTLAEIHESHRRAQNGL